MEKLKMESYALVAVQFLSAATMIYLVLPMHLSLLSIIMITTAIAIAFWAVLSMRIGNIRINPIPKEKAKLVMSGPYRHVRHPMYAAVLLAMLGIAININTWLGFAVWIVLFTDLIIKMRFEEKFLLEKFPEYAVYMKRTKRLVPWIW